MDIRSLELFQHLASSLHFSKTAESMFVRPSTLSRSIQRKKGGLFLPHYNIPCLHPIHGPDRPTSQLVRRRHVSIRVTEAHKTKTAF